MTAKKFTDQELLKLHSNLEDLSAKQQSGEVQLEQVIEEAKKTREELQNSHNPAETTETRKAVWKDVNDLIFLLEKEVGPKFGPNDALSISARKQVADVMSAINKMENSQKSESETLDKIKSLNDYGKGIHKDHKSMQNAYAAYYSKQAQNYLAYANSVNRSVKRDNAIANKTRTNENKYGKELAQSILNLLDK